MCIRDRAIAEGKGGFLRSKWCGALECEMAMKEQAGVTSRCMPLEPVSYTHLDVYKRQVYTLVMFPNFGM